LAWKDYSLGLIPVFVPNLHDGCQKVTHFSRLHLSFFHLRGAKLTCKRITHMLAEKCRPKDF